ncbi:antiviral RADAR system adenosine deaminase RdrB [Undibacterium crateris]|uniref:antiviral RADAR system adenosine deaminase RdrB n=1 Tax=Undibacterium crateris TaxID=2528175 RepID=UPI00138A0775|nr:antiviral RADAR system adenosine deaminase RdrB [Undibacterium crateris]NDI83998.1 hypothetical protein [Undibacterium crateris]
MLKPEIIQLGISTCFCSSAFATQLKQHLLSPDPCHLMEHSHFHAACLDVLQADLDRDWPRRFRLNEIRHGLQIVWPQTALRGPAFSSLDYLYEQLFIADGDALRYRDGQEQDYVRFCAQLDPALVVGWKFAQHLMSPHSLTTYDMQRIVGQQQALFSPAAVDGNAVAENHVHLGGVHTSGLALLLGVLAPDSDHLKQHPQHSTLCELQRVLHGLLTRASWLPESYEYGAEPTCDATLNLLLQDSLGERWRTQPQRRSDWQLIAQQSVHASVRDPAWLRQQMAVAMLAGRVAQAWLWLLIWLWRHYQSPQCPYALRVLIIYFLNRLMHLRRELIMDGQGLTRFVAYYDRPLRWGEQQPNHLNAAQVLFQHPDDVAELKVTRSKFNPEEIGLWLRQLASATGVAAPQGLAPLPADEAAAYRTLMDRWHFCIHFLRIPKFQHHPELVWREARQLREQCLSQAGWDRPELLGLSSRFPQDMRRQLLPVRWVRGLDVAGDENLVRVETYAPALRWLRQGLQHQAERQESVAGLHLSVHAGEDYAHPYSGMRHLDETVQFCEMRSGDRLGHALALGIRPRDWLQRHGDMVVPVDEHVDNLVWAWHYAGVMAERLPLAAQVMPMLERRIRRFLRYVPWMHPACLDWLQPGSTLKAAHEQFACKADAHITCTHPETLFKAWQLRRNCSWQLKQAELSGICDAESAQALPDRYKLMKPCTPPAQLQGDASTAEAASDYLPDVRLFRDRARWLDMQKGGKPAPAWGCRQTHAALPQVRVSLSGPEHSDSRWQQQALNALGTLSDQHTETELEFMEALQDYLLDLYDARGLMIEVNLTSNVYIARLESFSEHPVFRWYPVSESVLKPGEAANRFGLRRGPIKVCINTDDPGIMPTTLRTEFALLRAAAMEHGATRTDAESWTERLRQTGVQEFRRKHQAVWTQRSV